MQRLILALIVLVCFSAFIAEAAPRYTAARQTVRKVLEDQRELTRRINRLTPAEKVRLKAAVAGIDSDGDGLPNYLEDSLGSSSCDADSDDDGLSDEDDPFENDEDGDDDGFNDEDEVSATGVIASFLTPNLVVAGQTFIITEATTFTGRNFSSAEDLQADQCIKVEGHKVAADVIADKVEKKRSSSCD